MITVVEAHAVAKFDLGVWAQSVLRVLKLLFYVALSAHILGCFWQYVSRQPQPLAPTLR